MAVEFEMVVFDHARAVGPGDGAVIDQFLDRDQHPGQIQRVAAGDVEIAMRDEFAERVAPHHDRGGAVAVVRGDQGAAEADPADRPRRARDGAHQIADAQRLDQHLAAGRRDMRAAQHAQRRRRHRHVNRSGRRLPQFVLHGVVETVAPGGCGGDIAHRPGRQRGARADRDDAVGIAAHPRA